MYFFIKVTKFSQQHRILYLTKTISNYFHNICFSSFKLFKLLFQIPRKQHCIYKILINTTEHSRNGTYSTRKVRGKKLTDS